MQMIQANNGSSQSGSFVSNDKEYFATTGQFLTEDVENLVVGVNNMPVYLKQVAVQVDHQLQEVMCLLVMEKPMKNSKNKSEYPAVTISSEK
jgi:multidrug efflux pump subunit AcrB